MRQEAPPLSRFTPAPPDLTFLASLKPFKVKKKTKISCKREVPFCGSFSLNYRPVSPSLNSTDDETISEKSQHVKV